MRLSDYVISRINEITDCIFLVPGGGSMYLVDSIGRSKLRALPCHHEQACTMAAEGYTRISNRIGVACVTTGPGATNTITGVISAWVDSIPMLIISGQVRRATMIPRQHGNPTLRQLGFQEINIVDIVRPVTKYAKTITNANAIRYELEKALYLARAGRPGPVWLDIPLDIQRSEINPSRLKGFTAPAEKSVSLPMEKIIRMLQQAKKPLLLVGNGVRLSSGVDELRRFLGKTNINVVTAMSGDDLVNEDYPYYLGRQGMFSQPGANRVLDACDLLLSVGTRLSLMQTSFNYTKFAKYAYKIMVDVDASEMHKKILDIDLPLVCDAKVFFEKLSKEVIALQRWDVPRMRNTYPKTKRYLSAYEFAEALSGVANWPIVTSNGIASVCLHQMVRLKKNQRLMTNIGIGSMGAGLPMAIGACLASNRKPVICIEGDGSLMMNIQELETVAFNKLPLKIFIFNNNGYHSIKMTQKNFGQKKFAADPASGLGLPVWKRLIAGWGLKYYSIANAVQLKKLPAILKTPGPLVCEIILDPVQPLIEKWLAS